MRFSNKISKYSQISLLPLRRLNNPAERLYLGGIVALLVCYIGKIVGLSIFLRVSASFALWFFRLIFDNWWFWSIGIRCYFRLRILPPALSPTRSTALSPALSCSRCPTSASGQYRRIPIFWCKPSRPHTRTLSIEIGARSPLPVVHAPALGGHISALETSAAPAHHCGTSKTSAGCRSALPCQVPASESLTA